MRIHVYDRAEQAGEAAATVIAAQVIAKPESVLGLATGSSPIPIYQRLVEMYLQGVVDFSKVTTFNLDEYCKLPVEHECSYHRFMNEVLFSHINIPAEQVHLPNGNAKDMEKEGAAYDEAIAQAGGIDLQLLGIGHNGHIGFNEPLDRFVYGTHVVDLTASTIEANQRFFASAEDVPRQAVSMGIGGIMAARQIVLIATGKEKSEVIRRTIREDIQPEIQASILRTHPNVIFFLDREAASQL